MANSATGTLRPHHITTAVIPIAGLGTRMLPATKSVAKELLPVFDRPVIQHVVEEALDAGIDNFIFVTRPEKRAVLDHFRYDQALEVALASAGKIGLLGEVRSTTMSSTAIRSVYQHAPRGLGHAIYQAHQLISPNTSFAVLLPDEVYLGEALPMAELVDHHARVGGQVMGLKKVSATEVHRYGIADVGEVDAKGSVALKGMVEKPRLADAPSDLALVGRYIFDHRLFDFLANTAPDATGEIQLTDAVAASLNQLQTSGVSLSAERFDCGDRMGWIRAQSAFALAPDKGASCGLEAASDKAPFSLVAASASSRAKSQLSAAS